MLAAALFTDLSAALAPRQVVLRSCRRDQRDAIGPLSEVFTKFGRPARTRAAVRAAGLAAGTKSEQNKFDELKTFAGDPRSGWQVCYNLACYYAAQAHEPDLAIDWLETAMIRPGIEANGAWLAKDPDLESLRNLPRFKLIEQLLTSQPEES